MCRDSVGPAVQAFTAGEVLDTFGGSKVSTKNFLKGCMTYNGKTVIRSKTEGSRRNEQVTAGWRLVFSPAGSCAHHPVEKRNPISTFVSSAPRHHSSLLIYIDRLGAHVLVLAIPRLETVRYAPVFAAGYDLSLLRSVRLPGGNLHFVQANLY